MSDEGGRRVALVTGAGRRVGRAIALDLAAHGWAVAVHHHASAAGATAVVEEIRAAGVTAAAFGADLTDPVALEGLLPAVVAWSGRVDAVVCSAAGMTRTPLGSTTAAMVDGILALNLRAPFLLAQAAVPRLTAGGAIVLIGDHMADECWPDYAMHGVAKAGVHALTRHLAAALAPRLRVNAIAPGLVLPPEGMPPATLDRFVAATPLRREGTPGDVAQAVRFLLDAPFITGEVLAVDGGRHLGPPPP
jgi:pteridine reductase